MKIKILFVFLVCSTFITTAFQFSNTGLSNAYLNFYEAKLNRLSMSLDSLLAIAALSQDLDINKVSAQIERCRLDVKVADFWLRYFEPISQKQINGPLPVEWETEVFEKFENPYRREGAGLTLAALYLEEENVNRDTFIHFITKAKKALDTFHAETLLKELRNPAHFYYCNRLYLLNLAAIYTTGFECPQRELILPELRWMLKETKVLYQSFNASYGNYKIPENYLNKYNELVEFVNTQPNDIELLDHYTFVKQINILFQFNQENMRNYGCISRNVTDFALNKSAKTIFDKQLYMAQNEKGIYSSLQNEDLLNEIAEVGKLLFYDPILSKNLQRSCGSCHKNNEMFTDTIQKSAENYNRTGRLARNTPSLINAGLNHLLMWDGRHYNLQNQAKDVITNPDELAMVEQEILERVLGCKTYKKKFQKFVKALPGSSTLKLEHVLSSITLYYARLNRFYSPFDYAMNGGVEISTQVQNGFNLFMGKAQCATCHFVPHFNGVKPPYTGSEFEVLGTPGVVDGSVLSEDLGRFGFHNAHEMHKAFRTPTLRNVSKTKPYMHNGVFNSLTEVMEFYNKGGGNGYGLGVPNQTLSSDSLGLTAIEIRDIIAFMESLNEDIVAESIPAQVPESRNKNMKNRIPVGIY